MATKTSESRRSRIPGAAGDADRTRRPCRDPVQQSEHYEMFQMNEDGTTKVVFRP
jgi:hypothetical protein